MSQHRSVDTSDPAPSSTTEMVSRVSESRSRPGMRNYETCMEGSLNCPIPLWFGRAWEQPCRGRGCRAGLGQGWDRNKTKTSPAQLDWSCFPEQEVRDVHHFMDPDKEPMQDQARLLQL